MDAKSMNMEYNQLKHRDPIKDVDGRAVITFITTWEAELHRVEKLDPGYACGKHPRKPFLFKALPQDGRTSIETEEAVGRLRLYEDLKSYVTTPAASSMYSRN